MGLDVYVSVIPNERFPTNDRHLWDRRASIDIQDLDTGDEEDLVWQLLSSKNRHWEIFHWGRRNPGYDICHFFMFRFNCPSDEWYRIGTVSQVRAILGREIPRLLKGIPVRTPKLTPKEWPCNLVSDQFLLEDYMRKKVVKEFRKLLHELSKHPLTDQVIFHQSH